MHYLLSNLVPSLGSQLDLSLTEFLLLLVHSKESWKSTCHHTTVECALLGIWLCGPHNKRTSFSTTFLPPSRRTPNLEQCPGSATLTWILKETVQQLRVLLNPEYPLFGVLPYGELLMHLCDHWPCSLHPDQLLLTESVRDFITKEQEAHMEREQTGEYTAHGGIQTCCHDVNHQQH